MSNTDKIYRDMSTIRYKRDKLEQLGYEIRNRKSDCVYLNELLVYAKENNIVHFESAVKEIDRKINSLQRISSIIKNNMDVKNMDDLGKKIVDLSEINDLENQYSADEKEIAELLIAMDLCSVCLGKGDVYDREAGSGDPYGRSSDYRKPCPTCKGDGKHHPKES
jgi:hypothetical protein